MTDSAGDIEPIEMQATMGIWTLEAFPLVELVSARKSGYSLSVSIVMITSSKILMIPDFVLYFLIVGRVCPNCHGHIVPITRFLCIASIRSGSPFVNL